MSKPNDCAIWMAEHLLKKLNALGIVKEAQVNNTTVVFLAGQIDEYMLSNQLVFKIKEPQ